MKLQVKTMLAIDMTEEHAKQILQFLANRCSHRAVHIFLSHTQLINLNYLVAIRQNDDDIRYLRHGTENFIEIYNESYVSVLERCLKVASTEDVWIYSFKNNCTVNNILDTDVFLSKGTTLEQILIDIDLSEYA